MSRYHQGCSASFHDSLIVDEYAWRANVSRREFQHLTGTAACVERGTCVHCSRTIIRRRLPMASVVA